MTRIFTRPAPGTLRLALFSLAFLLLALAWFVTAGGDMSPKELAQASNTTNKSYWGTQTFADTIPPATITWITRTKSVNLDSLTERVERLEKRNETATDKLLAILLGICLGLGLYGFFNGISHKHKKWTEVHK